MIDLVKDAFNSIQSNWLRSCMAGFGIAWGILLLILFLGIGRGFKQKIMSQMGIYAQKSVFVYGGTTSKNTKTMNNGAYVTFEGEIVNLLTKRYPCIEYCSEEVNAGNKVALYNDKIANASVIGVSNGYFNIRLLYVSQGRCLSQIDDFGGRHVAVIGERICNELFHNDKVLGNKFMLDGILFEVVGVLSSENLFSMQEGRSIYIPSSTLLSTFDTHNKISAFCFSLKKGTDTSFLKTDLNGYLAFRCGFDPHDSRAINIIDIESQTAIFEQLFTGLDILIWVIGVCLLLSGISGVGNVMLIVVKDRTNEIGIRKAIGAKSSSVIYMFLTESVIITLSSGIVGLCIGIGVIELVNRIIIPLISSPILDRLILNQTAIIFALLTLCFCGIIAGLIPALKASRITPVDAIRFGLRD